MIALGGAVAVYTFIIDSDDESSKALPGPTQTFVPIPTPTAIVPSDETTVVVALEPECAYEGTYDASGPKVPLGQLWDATVCPRLGDELWTGRLAYDYGHYLMVPLHAAFQLKEEGWQEQFAKHFQRYMLEGSDGRLTSSNALSRMHYLYLASRFTVLAEQSGRRELIPVGLMDALYATIEALWNRIPTPGGKLQVVTRKLSDRNLGITDDEMFIFAIAAELRAHERISQSGVGSSTVTGILDTARSVLEQRVVTQEEGGWLFQPGVWAENPEFAYAGREEEVPGMAPFPLADVAEDTSHSHRWPLWLTSLSNAYSEGDPERGFYDDLRKGLEQQFFDKVLVPPTSEFPAYRTNNFMDGRNGVYRWEYSSLGPNNGYGPFELSGTMMMGWWTFLDTNRIRDVYQDTAERFPLPSRAIDLYWGHMRSQGQYPSRFNQLIGFYELIARLAARLSLSPTLEPLVK